MEAKQEEQARQMAELHEQRTSCGRIMSACEPGWKSAKPRNLRNLSAHFLLPVPAKAKRSLHRTKSTYRRMTSYPPEIPCSHAIQHPQTPWKPNLEKGHLADPTDLSVSQGAGCIENPARTNDRQRQLTNMCLTGLGASPRQYHPCTRPLGPPPLLK